MKYLEHSFETPEENLACDEALLDDCESGGPEVLRFWTSSRWFVVVGHGEHVSKQANLEACGRDGIPILRRCSGGGTVLQGPGCLNYALVLKIPENGPLATVTGTNRAIMDCHRTALELLVGQAVGVRGITDLTLGDLKFSGNAQRRKRHALLFQGTFLLNLDLNQVARYLATPERQPDYRQQRPHGSFLCNLGLEPPRVTIALQKAWQATEPLTTLPWDAVNRLVQARYRDPAWNLKFP